MTVTLLGNEPNRQLMYEYPYPYGLEPDDTDSA